VGKTLLVESVMSSLQQRFNTDASNPTVGVVRLNGYVHGDDRSALPALQHCCHSWPGAQHRPATSCHACPPACLHACTRLHASPTTSTPPMSDSATPALRCPRTAFQEVARQLCTQFQCTFSKAASFDENVAFLREMLATVQRAFKTVVFVLDEMEQYTRRSKQLVLYNLLDALQSASVRVGGGHVGGHGAARPVHGAAGLVHGAAGLVRVRRVLCIVRPGAVQPDHALQNGSVGASTRAQWIHINAGAMRGAAQLGAGAARRSCLQQ
jgi:hypothetical protein